MLRESISKVCFNVSLFDSMDRVRQVISDHPHIAFGTAAAVLFGTSMALSSSQEGAPSERRFDFSKQSIRLEVR